MEMSAEADRVVLFDAGVRRVHLVGIGGAGMKAVADVFIDRKFAVSGSDREPSKSAVAYFQSRGVQIQSGHRALDSEIDAVVYSPAIGEQNPERQSASQLGIPAYSSIDLLAKISEQTQCIAVAGTHGKSSTTALLGHLLTSAEVDPTVICGAQQCDSLRSGRAGSSQVSVMEACEYQRHFERLSPQIAIVTGIEPDHFDCYPTINHAMAAYASFLDRVPKDGTIISRSDCAVTQEVLRQLGRTTVTISANDSSADWSAKNVNTQNGEMTFRLSHQQNEIGSGRLSMSHGQYLPNVLAAIAATSEMGINPASLLNEVASFPGLVRRFELKEPFEGSTVVDDYAHHPTEISFAIQSARHSFPGLKITCVFQPHQVSRTRGLMAEFAEALALADQCWVLPVFGARESCVAELVPCARELVSRIRSRGKPAELLTTLDQVWSTMETVAGPDTLIMTLGAGDITRIHDEFT